MEKENLKTAKMAARVTAAQKKQYHSMSEKLHITEADFVRRALGYYAHQCQDELEWIEAGASAGIA